MVGSLPRFHRFARSADANVGLQRIVSLIWSAARRGGHVGVDREPVTPARVALRGLENDLYFQIGLLTLVGLAAKNAILIVEFAVVLQQEGRSVRDAAIEAARLRFRPILMTSLAFVLGVVPLVVADGAGAAGRHSIGTGVLGGMIAATVLAVLFVPLWFFLLRREAKPAAGAAGAVREEERGHGD
jgi:predicted RND superfamily exporter protein